MNGCTWMYLTGSLNGLRLGWEYGTSSFRTWFSYRIISLFAPFDKYFVFGHTTPSFLMSRIHRTIPLAPH